MVTTWEKHLKGFLKKRSACFLNPENGLIVIWETCKKYFIAIRQHLLDNHECDRNYKEDNIFVLRKAKNNFSHPFLKHYVFSF